MSQLHGLLLTSLTLNASTQFGVLLPIEFGERSCRNADEIPGHALSQAQFKEVD